jgi:hypothetical protein
MKKQLLILLCLPLLFSCGGGEASSQNTSQSTYNTVTFIDGETMKRGPFIDECMASMGQGKNKELFKNGGLDYCNCFLDKLAERYTLPDFTFDYYTARGTTENFEEAAYQLYKNPKILAVLEECMADPAVMNDVKMEISSKEMLALHISQCKDALKMNMSLEEYNELLKYVYVDEYCACYMQKMTNEFTLKEMDNLEQRDNLIKLEKIQEDCMFDNLR